MDRVSRSTKLSRLFPGTRYLICVIALGNWATRKQDFSDLRLARKNENSTREDWEVFSDSMLSLLVDSPSSKCEEVSTLETPGSIHGELGSLPDHSFGIQSILTRRLGLIVGCCMGIIVFIILVSVLGYLKVKKQRNAIKRNRPAIPPEYISYRHFSIQSGEAGGQSGHPQFITNMNTTSFTS